MTLYHNSPRTGLASRCRAKEACPFGTSHGTTIRRDGTVEVGTGSPTWTTMAKPPRRREERVLIDDDGNAVLTYEKPNRMPEPEEKTVEKVAAKAAAVPNTDRKKDRTPKRIDSVTGEEINPFDEVLGDSDDVDHIDFGIEVSRSTTVTHIDNSKKNSTTEEKGHYEFSENNDTMTINVNEKSISVDYNEWIRSTTNIRGLIRNNTELDIDDMKKRTREEKLFAAEDNAYEANEILRGRWERERNPGKKVVSYLERKTGEKFSGKEVKFTGGLTPRITAKDVLDAFDLN